MQVAVWGMPTALGAFVIHSVRLYLLDRRLDKELGRGATANGSSDARTSDPSLLAGAQAHPSSAAGE
jgi:hypothetical protein